MGILGWVVLFVVILIVIFAFDRYLLVKEIERDLKEYLGDLLVDRDSASEKCKCCRQSNVFAIKSLIRKHFKF